MGSSVKFLNRVSNNPLQSHHLCSTNDDITTSQTNELSVSNDLVHTKNVDLNLDSEQFSQIMLMCLYFDHKLVLR